MALVADSTTMRYNHKKEGELNQEIKEKWVKALRSGGHEQGVGSLRRGDRFCCLGVICDIVDPEGWEEPEAISGITTHRGFTFVPSYEIQSFIELDRTVVGVLATMNDISCKSFSEIADYIEESL